MLQFELDEEGAILALIFDPIEKEHDGEKLNISKMFSSLDEVTHAKTDSQVDYKDLDNSNVSIEKHINRESIVKWCKGNLYRRYCFDLAKINPNSSGISPELKIECLNVNGKYVIRKTSEEWQKECKFKVVDPDGWDRKNFDFSWKEEKITKEEFEKRLMRSTIDLQGNSIKSIWKE